MSLPAVTTEHPRPANATGHPGSGPSAESPHADGGRAGTLEALIVAVWEELAAGRQARCPLCAGQLQPRFGAHARPVGGRCRRCGTALD